MIIYVYGGRMKEKADMKNYIIKTLKILILLKALDDDESIAQLEDDLLDVLSRKNVMDMKIVAGRMSSILIRNIIKYVHSVTEGSGVDKKSNMSRMILYYMAAISFGGDESVKSLDIAYDGKGVKPALIKKLKKGIIKNSLRGLDDSLKCLDFAED